MFTFARSFHVRVRVLRAKNLAMSSGRTCRLCCSVISSHQYLSLFTASSILNKWPSRIQDLLGLSVSADDGLPQHICSACRKRVEVLEQAALDLVAFQKQAQDVSVSLSKRPPKRTKETSGSVGVSPDTVRARPRTKRLTVRRLDFENGMVMSLYRG